MFQKKCALFKDLVNAEVTLAIMRYAEQVFLKTLIE